MKKILFILIIVYCIPSFAIHTTITSSIYTTDDGHGFVQNNLPIPTSIRRVRFINLLDSCPEAEIALTAAEYIFSDVMKNEGIDLVPLNATVIWGEASDFAIDELCQVSIVYTDTTKFNAYYYEFDQYSDMAMPILIPISMYYQCLGKSYGPCMHIKLNPNIPYHFNTSDTPLDKYDAVTILLRALAMGCGIQSTLNPVTMEFGLTQNGQTYISAFDSRIYNDLNATCFDVISGDISILTFLLNRSIYTEGINQTYPLLLPVKLYNDWENGLIGTNVTSYTANTISPDIYTEDELEDDFYDLLDPFLSTGIAQHTITKYTMAILRGMGWQKTIPVGLDDELNNLYSCTLTCSNTLLLPDNYYSIGLSHNIQLQNAVCKLQSMDSSYNVGTFNGYPLSFSYHSVPSNIQWKRNPTTKNIIGQIQGNAILYLDGHTYESTKTYDIEIPYKPNKPLIQKSESTSNGYITLNLKAFANGSNNYTVTYTGVTYGDVHSFITTANSIDTILNNIPSNQLYNISIYGTNNEGNSDSYNFTFGFSAHPTLNMTVSVNGNILRYDLSNNGTIDISDVTISSVKITKPNGLIVSSPVAGSGDPINISMLERGFYILTVIADGNTYSRQFYKR